MGLIAARAPAGWDKQPTRQPLCDGLVRIPTRRSGRTGVARADPSRRASRPRQPYHVTFVLCGSRRRVENPAIRG